MPANATMHDLSWYLERIKNTPLLTAKEEQQLSRRIREHSDPIARQQMIHANLLLVVKLAKQYSSHGMTFSDLVAEGNLGLMRAVENFDPDQGVRFSTYASWWIKQAIKKAMISTGQPIRVPAYLAKLINKWRRVARELLSELGRPADIVEIAKRMKISYKRAELIQQGIWAVTAPTQIGSDEAQAAAEMLTDTRGSTPDQRLMNESLTPTMQIALEQINTRSREILILRFGLDGHPKPRTYKEIGEIIGLTRERVRQLEKIALAELKKAAEKIV
ncbi:MAG: RNA polymerase sigma factor RpoD/SigA [Phycisphaerae bacterium]|nr:RNA polymerase sigma factor RpoD/SigA [Phycisphaerae bacterium]